MHGKGASGGQYGNPKEQDDGGCGGWGGDGGDGGLGGKGGGGGGGPTICIVTVGSSVFVPGTTKCKRGKAGTGGTSQVSDGADGYGGTILEIN